MEGRGAFEIYRKKYGLLSADEIRAVRERHGLTQARWEAGRNVLNVLAPGP